MTVDEAVHEFSLKALKAAGFEGGDASLRISLDEYGLAWVEEADEIRFVHRVPGRPGFFDTARVKKGATLKSEYAWADAAGLASFTGNPDIAQAPTLELVQAVVGYYGEENAFGSSKRGWKIKGLEEDNGETT